MGGVHAFKVLFQTDISVVSKQFYALPSDACLPLSTFHHSAQNYHSEQHSYSDRTLGFLMAIPR